MAVVATTQQTTLKASTAGGRGQRFVRTGRTAPGLFIAGSDQRLEYNNGLSIGSRLMLILTCCRQ